MTMMKAPVRLVTYGYHGAPAPPPLTVTRSAAALWQAAQEPGQGAHNLVAVPLERGRAGRAATAGMLLRLSHRRLFVGAHNEPSAWSEILAGGHLRGLRSNPFGTVAGGDAAALEHSDSTAYAASHYVSLGAPAAGALPLLPNRPFSLNLFLYEPQEGQRLHLFQVRTGRFCWQLRNFRAEAMWLSPAWTAEGEAELHALWKLPSLTAPQRARREELLALLYEARTSMDLGGREAFAGQPIRLDFMPEPVAGRVAVETGAGLRAVLQVPRQGVPEHEPLTLWNEGRLHLLCNGGAYFWQVGFPEFAAQGELTVPVKLPVLQEDMGPLTVSFNGEAAAGAVLSLEQEPGANVYRANLLLRLQSTAGQYSPCLHGLSAHYEAGAPTGEEEVSWDSDEHTLPLGPGGAVCPFLEASALYSENGRCSWQLTLPLLDGQLLAGLPGMNYPYLEDRIASLWINGEAVVTRGLITASQVTELATLRPNQASLAVEHPHSTLQLTLTDGWAVCREAILTNQLVGDGMRLGAYARRLLRFAGFYAWQLAELEESGGQKIPRAAVGEPWAEMPAQFSSVASVLEQLEKKYGLGARFVYGSDGKWRLVRPGTEVAATLGALVLPDPHTPEGRGSLLGLQVNRGEPAAYNAFVVLGANRADGTPWSASFYDRLSRYPSGGGNILNFRGRWRVHPPLIDRALRSQEACDIALRSLRLLNPASGRTALLSTYFRADLRPGQLLDVDGRRCRIQKLTASWATDTLELAVREEASPL